MIFVMGGGGGGICNVIVMHSVLNRQFSCDKFITKIHG